jgi:hypothetical protein
MPYKNILITGAANGIGRELAIELSRQVSSLILIDRDTTGNLEIVSSACQANGAIVFSAILDVQESKKVRVFLNQILSEKLEVDLVLACAGYLSQKSTLSNELHKGETCMETNYYGVVNIFEYFKQTAELRSNQVLKLVAITSISKLVSTVNSGFYSASKAALAAYLNSLRVQTKSNNIQVHEIVLGFVRTNMIRDIPHAKALSISPQKASKLILRAIDRRISRVHSIPRFRNFPWFMIRLLPSYLIEKIFSFLSFVHLKKSGKFCAPNK